MLLIKGDFWPLWKNGGDTICHQEMNLITVEHTKLCEGPVGELWAVFHYNGEGKKEGLTRKEFLTIIGERCANKFSRQVDRRETTHTKNPLCLSEFIPYFSKVHTC